MLELLAHSRHAVKKVVVGCLLRARSLLLCKLQGRLRRELRGMDALHCSFDVLVLVFVSSLARFELCCSLACRLEAEVLEDLGRREVPVHLATANAFRLHFFFSFCSILLKNCHRLRGSSGARHGSFIGPIPIITPNYGGFKKRTGFNLRGYTESNSTSRIKLRVRRN